MNRLVFHQAHGYSRLTLTTHPPLPPLLFLLLQITGVPCICFCGMSGGVWNAFSLPFLPRWAMLYLDYCHSLHSSLLKTLTSVFTWPAGGRGWTGYLLCLRPWPTGVGNCLFCCLDSIPADHSGAVLLLTRWFCTNWRCCFTKRAKLILSTFQVIVLV